MNPILFTMPGTEPFAAQLLPALQSVVQCDAGEMQLHEFPDGECCPRLLTSVDGRDVMFACALDRPAGKILALYLAACTARELGARRVGFIIPYLPYMRQDARFNAGEGITSAQFARLMSSCCDWLVTVDPHLHRHHDLSDIYSVASRVAHAAPDIAEWIAANVTLPVIIGPDSESAQWVAQVAGVIGCPYAVLEKKRNGDRAVEVSIPDPSAWLDRTPVLVDDIVSTARTMIAAAQQIKAAGMAAPICIAVHALLAGDAYAALRVSGVDRIVSCNTVEHATNLIDICRPVAIAVGELLGEQV